MGGNNAFKLNSKITHNVDCPLGPVLARLVPPARRADLSDDDLLLDDTVEAGHVLAVLGQVAGAVVRHLELASGRSAAFDLEFIAVRRPSPGND